MICGCLRDRYMEYSWRSNCNVVPSGCDLHSWGQNARTFTTFNMLVSSWLLRMWKSETEMRFVVVWRNNAVAWSLCCYVTFLCTVIIIISCSVPCTVIDSDSNDHGTYLQCEQHKMIIWVIVQGAKTRTTLSAPLWRAGQRGGSVGQLPGAPRRQWKNRQCGCW
jgi:hypothetical protein